MTPKKWCFLLIGCLLLLGCSYPNVRFTSGAFPDFLEVGSYAQYEQHFSNGEVHELFWRIHSLNATMAEIMIRSHGIELNYSTGKLAIVPGGGHMIINRNTWVILYCYLANGTEVLGPPVGETLAFWISTNINETTPIDTMYDQHIRPQSSEPLYLACLPAPRTCWLTKNVYSAGNTMNRWYDKETGIVLMIETQITSGRSSLSILETLNSTNISALLGVPSLLVIGVIGIGVLIGLIIAMTIFVTLRQRKSREAS